MATTTITKPATANITLTAGQWLVVSGDGTYTLGPGLYNGKIVGVVNGAKIGPFPFDQTVVLCASVTDLVYYTQSAPIGTYPMSVDPESGLITDPVQRAAVAEAAGGGSVTIVNDLTTGGATSALSAEQGKVLKAAVDAKQAKSAVSAESASRGLVAADDAKTLICTSTPTFTVPTGLPAGFGVAAKGACTFTAGSGATAGGVLGLTNGFGLILNSTGKATIQKVSNTTMGTATTALAQNTLGQLSATYDSSGNFAFWLNGAANGSGTNLQTFSAGSSAIGTTLADGGGIGWTGYMPELIVFDAAIPSTADRQAVEASQKAYWGTP